MRMRKRLKRNYKGTDHHGAAADYLEVQETPENGDDPSHLIEDRKRILESTPLPPAEAAKLSPEQSTFEETGEDDSFQSDVGEYEDRRDDREYRLSISSKQSSSDEHITVASSTGPSASSGLVSGTTRMGMTEAHEKPLLEIPAVMVQPLRVSKGIFQVR